jgi:hypothetical protein
MATVSISGVSSSDIQLTIAHVQLADFLSRHPRFATLFEYSVKTNAIHWWKSIQECFEEIQQDTSSDVTLFMEGMNQLEMRLKAHIQEAITDELGQNVQGYVKQAFESDIKPQVTAAISESMQRSTVDSATLVGAIRCDTTDIKKSLSALTDTKTSKSIGAMAEDKVFHKLSGTLSQEFVVEFTRQNPNEADLKVKKIGYTDIMVEIKNHSKDVTHDHVVRFEDNIAQHNSHGIIVSLQSGIVGRNDTFTMRENGGKLSLYLCHNNYDMNAVRDLVRFIHRYEDMMSPDDKGAGLSAESLQQVTDLVKNQIKRVKKAREIAKNMDDLAKGMTMELDAALKLLQKEHGVRVVGYCSVCAKHFDGACDKGWNNHTGNKHGPGDPEYDMNNPCRDAVLQPLPPKKPIKRPVHFKTKEKVEKSSTVSISKEAIKSFENKRESLMGEFSPTSTTPSSPKSED